MLNLSVTKVQDGLLICDANLSGGTYVSERQIVVGVADADVVVVVVVVVEVEVEAVVELAGAPGDTMKPHQA